jgi:hypothetical protein
MNRPCDVSTVVEEDVIGSMSHRGFQVRKAIHVLSVGAMDYGCMVHDALLSGPRFRLSVATDYRELWMIPNQESLQVVILHDTLSSSELEYASRLIRRRWPRVRILVVCNGEGFLDDALYDVRVVSNVSREVLQTTIERLIGGWHEWRSRDAEL